MKASFKLCLTLFSLSALLLFNSCSSDQQYQWPEEKDQQVDINAPSDEGSETVTTGEELSTGDDKDNTSDDNSSSDQSIAEGEVVTDLVKMTKTAPEKASLGEPFKTEIVVEAVNNLASVQVKDLVPEGAELVKTEPEAINSGRSLVWNFGPQNAGDKETISIWLKPTQEGSLGSCASVTAVPRACVTTVIGKATLEIAKTGPEKALLGQEITYDIVVKNTGNALAKNVVVTDTIPDGLSHASGEKELEFVVGDLEPEESKTLSVTVKADARGKFCNNASAIGSNAEEVDDEACTVITQPGLKVVKTGTERQFTGKVATYDIQVTNIGDTVLNDVVTTDILPEGTRLISADGGTAEGNKVTWTTASLQPEEVKNYTVSIISLQAGTLCNTVSVQDSTGLSDSAEACTKWEGHPAILFEVVDTEDPILPGDETSYIIKVTNQGTAPDTNVSFSATFTDEVSPLSVEGPTEGMINGKAVTVKTLPVLKAKEAIEWRIKAKAVKTGDARITFRLSSDILKRQPVIEEESTQVY